MLVRCFLVAMLIATLSVGVWAQDETPKIGILRYGPLANMQFIEGAILDVLESYGYLSAEENASLRERTDFEGENISIIWGDAAFDLPTASLVLAAAIDQNVDALITLGTPLTQLAVSETLDMADPVPLIFAAVPAPFDIGIADAPCVKPAHVTGTSGLTSYAYVFDALKTQNPDIETIGTLFNTADSAGVYGAEEIAAEGEASGIPVASVGVTSVTDLRAATSALLDAGVEALVLPIDSVTAPGLPIIVGAANEMNLPVFFPSFSAINAGATIGAGASPFYEQGEIVGRILAAHLNGEVNLPSVAIGETGDLRLGVNLDSAAEQGVEINEAILEEAVAVIEGGRISKLAPGVLAAIARRGVIIPLEERQADDMAWLESMQCADEMIAQQQAELDAASE